MRILHVMRAPVGGLFRHVLDLSAEQARLGHDVGLVVATSGDVLTERRLEAAAQHLSLGVHRIAISRSVGISDLAGCRSVRRRARDVSCGVLHGHGAKGGAYARIGGAGLGLSVFYTPHGGTLNYAPASLTGRVYHGMERALDRVTTGVIFESAHAQRTYGAVVGRGRAPQRVIHNGLRPFDFSPASPRPDAAHILFVGELRELKGVDVLLRAIARLNAERGQPIRAVIVGSGPDRDGYVRLAADLGLGGAVSFPGAMPAAEAFALGRVIAVPSRNESLPYIVLEAAAAGLPLVATAVGGIPEIVAGTDTGLIAPDNVEALADALGGLIDDPAAAEARAQRLRARVEDRFTVRRMAEEVVGFYANPVERPAPCLDAVAAHS